MAITASQPFSAWEQVFREEEVMTVAVIDRLVHRSIVPELDAESCRRRQACSVVSASTSKSSTGIRTRAPVWPEPARGLYSHLAAALRVGGCPPPPFDPSP
ncbi:ATP-binding protein [Acidithiobacillus caldus ATCC 51756]|uniref:ATP-binding protein n=1 Tax=Acidithiobacillus caldus TaxID=33059 RepID=UPI00146F9F0A|nr:ATP-binding protein [Acidithiobacillus caldus]MBU2735096.1 ATP-binding protein [Acidithiobacillus caldus ATCC 51756]MBU2745351.1 ATP-binding protein [Acidithiobacillus caldus]MBU2781193.1 ATP-binding protein [Acidithiobacillus caldus]